MPPPTRVMLEIGPQGKRVIACALDWPGWERNARSEEESLVTLERHRARYRPVTELAGLAATFDAETALEVVERVEGTSTTDVWRIATRSPVVTPLLESDAELERWVTLLRACWAFFDATWPGISPEIRRGPRGGGRMRDQVVAHTYGSEKDYAAKLGVRWDDAILHDAERRAAFRDAFVEALRTSHREGRMARTWTVAFTIRRTCYHLMDHAWELQDKDLTGQQP